MTAFNPDKPVQTRDGRKARIVDKNYKGSWHNQPILAILEAKDGSGESCTTHNTDGGYHHTGAASPADLINIPERREGWLNVYSPSSNDTGVATNMWASKDLADRNGTHRRIACIHISFVEGEGL